MKARLTLAALDAALDAIGDLEPTQLFMAPSVRRRLVRAQCYNWRWRARLWKRQQQRRRGCNSRRGR